MDYKYFMEKALIQAQQALAAGEFPVGCVLVYRNRVLASGARMGSTADGRNEIDHAEMVALRHLVKLENNIDRSQIVAFSTLEPCLMCHSALILAGIGIIVYAYEDVMGGGTGCELSHLAPLYRHSKVKIVPGILRMESLRLFQKYFADPAHSYLRDSLLAEYTLSLRW